jgi:hypothetical protein
MSAGAISCLHNTCYRTLNILFDLRKDKVKGDGQECPSHTEPSHMHTPHNHFSVYFTRHQSARTPSFQPIFLPSS